MDHLVGLDFRQVHKQIFVMDQHSYVVFAVMQFVCDLCWQGFKGPPGTEGAEGKPGTQVPIL